MNNSILASREAVGDLARVVPRVHVHRPCASLCPFRAWMNEPAHHERTHVEAVAATRGSPNIDRRGHR
jgi:hypothetical protein